MSSINCLGARNIIVNVHVELLFIDYTPQYLRTVKGMLEANSRRSYEFIHLVHTIEDGIQILCERDTVEMIVLHTQPDKVTIKRGLTKLRRVSLAEIMIIAMFEVQEDITEIYSYGMNTFVPPVYKPEVAVAYFESFIGRHRHIPSINCMKEVEHIKDNAKMQCGDLIIDPARQLLECNNQRIDLSTMEFKLLHFMARNEGIIFTQDELFFHVWGGDVRYSSDLTSRITRLRKKIEPDPHNPTYIKTKRGSGYYFTSK